MLRLFRKRPIVVQAVLTSDIIKAVFAEFRKEGWEALPYWIKFAYDAGNLIIGSDHVDVLTPEGIMIAQSDDYIIRGIKGELYPCKPDILALSYDEIKGETPPRT